MKNYGFFFLPHKEENLLELIFQMNKLPKCFFCLNKKTKFVKEENTNTHLSPHKV